MKNKEEIVNSVFQKLENYNFGYLSRMVKGEIERLIEEKTNNKIKVDNLILEVSNQIKNEFDLK